MLVIGKEEIKSRAYYSLEFDISGEVFSNNNNNNNKFVKSPSKALELAILLKSKGIEPKISREIIWSYDKSGRSVKGSEFEELTYEHLEQIARTNEPTPSFYQDRIAQDISGADIGD